VQPLLLPRPREALHERRAAAEVLQPAEDAQLRHDLLGAVGHRRAAQREAQRVVGQRVRQPPHGLGALRARVLAVVRLVEDERPRPPAGERLALRGDRLVAQDRDVGRGRHPAAAREQRHVAVRQPVGGLALPHEAQARGAHDDGGERVVGLERRQRLHGLAEARLVGEERAARLQQVADARPLERRQLAAERQVERLAGPRAGPAHRLDRLVVLRAHPGEHRDGGG
jgi:hypothetical protein